MADSNESQRWAFDLGRRTAERAHDRHYEVADAARNATIEMAQSAIRFTVLINGGAAVAILAFIGALAGKLDFPIASTKTVAASLIWFALGIGCAGVAYISAYFSLSLSAKLLINLPLIWEHPWIVRQKGFRHWVSLVFEVLGVVATIGALGLFLIGVLNVNKSINAF